MPKKIALAMEFFSRHKGGAESYSVGLADSLIKAGWEVHFFGYGWDNEPPEAVFHQMTKPGFMPSFLKILHFARQHKKMIKPKDFDVVLGFGNTITMNAYQSHGGIHKISTLKKLPAKRNLIVRIIDRLTFPVNPKHIVRRYIESAPFRIKPRPKIVAIADMIRNDMASYYHINPDEIEVVYNGIFPDRYGVKALAPSKGIARSKFGINPDDVVFLFVSFDFKKKGGYVLMEAAAKLKKLTNQHFKVVFV